MSVGLPLLLIALAPAPGPDGRSCAETPTRVDRADGGRPTPPVVGRVAVPFHGPLTPSSATGTAADEQVRPHADPARAPSALRVSVGRANRVTDDARGFHPTGPP